MTRVHAVVTVVFYCVLTIVICGTMHAHLGMQRMWHLVGRLLIHWHHRIHQELRTWVRCQAVGKDLVCIFHCNNNSGSNNSNYTRKKMVKIFAKFCNHSCSVLWLENAKFVIILWHVLLSNMTSHRCKSYWSLTWTIISQKMFVYFLILIGL